MLTIACVWTGAKYGRDYVERLRNMVTRNLAVPHRFVCLTDHQVTPPGIDMVYVGHLGLPGWWAKMALFSPEIRGSGRCLYLDLDTIIVGDLAPLAAWSGDFGICENFTRLAGNEAWPCRYGSCVMSLAAGWGGAVWDAFQDQSAPLMVEADRLGDQWAIEQLAPEAALLQRELPAGFFLNKRELAAHRSAPASCSVVVFGGRQRPDNCKVEWVREHWK